MRRRGERNGRGWRGNYSRSGRAPLAHAEEMSQEVLGLEQKMSQAAEEVREAGGRSRHGHGDDNRARSGAGP